MCPPVSPCRGASIDNGCASCAMHKHFNAWRCLLCGWGTCLLWMETPPLWLWTCLLRMETPLRGRSGGHTGTAPTISRVVPCSKVAGEQFADGLNRKRLPANSSPMYKHKKCMLANSSPMDKIEKRLLANSSPPIIRVVYRRKTVRRQYSALFIAGKEFAADIPRCLSQERCSPPIIRVVYRRKRVRRR